MAMAFLGDELRAVDYDAYLLSLFAPRKVREGLWALFLFSHEISKTRDMVTDTNLGLIRLQWWRDEIAKMYSVGHCEKIPVLSTMAPFVHAQGVPQSWFEDLLYAREFDLMDKAPANWDGLCRYGNFITTPLNRIALKMMGQEADEHEIIDVSTYFGLQKIIRSVPNMLLNRRCYLPEDMLIEKKLTIQKVIDFNHKEQVIDVVKNVIQLMDRQKIAENSFLRLEQKMTSIYLKKLKNLLFDVFSPEFQSQPYFFAFRLMLSSAKK